MTVRHELATRTKHRLTVDEFLLLDRAGAFGDRRTELIDGEVFYMGPKHRVHARAMTKMIVALTQALADQASELGVLTDVSVRISAHAAPEPDIVVASECDGHGIVPLETVRLIVEIADSTLPTDLGLKAELYACAAIPEYWVVDVEGGKLHQMWAPQGNDYAKKQEVPMGQHIVAATLAGLELSA
jgi:Uma2 family endonuclease